MGYVLISIHALVKRATLRVIKISMFHMISIHALVKRATSGADSIEYGGKISIHALVKRATLVIHPIRRHYLYFNPRPREEGDDTLNIINDILPYISIHALVKRATN